MPIRLGIVHPLLLALSTQIVPSEAVSLGVVGLTSFPIPSSAFSPVVLLSHLRFCDPCVYRTHYLIVHHHLTTIGWFAGVLSQTPLACILPTDN